MVDDAEDKVVETVGDGGGREQGAGRERYQDLQEELVEVEQFVRWLKRLLGWGGDATGAYFIGKAVESLLTRSRHCRDRRSVFSRQKRMLREALRGFCGI